MAERERFYPEEVERVYGMNRYKTWVIRDRLKFGTIAVFGGLMVPGLLSETEAIDYAKRLNGMV